MKKPLITKTKFVYEKYYNGFNEKLQSEIDKIQETEDFQDLSIQYVVSINAGAFTALIVARFKSKEE